MEKTSLSEIRKELSFIPREELVAICLRMARFKKENKEHLAYLLFQKDEAEFIAEINEEITDTLADIHWMNTLQAKKALQKTLRNISKNKKFSLSKIYEMEAMLHFIRTMMEKEIPHSSSAYLHQFYSKQVVKLPKILGSLNEEIQTDYRDEVEALTKKVYRY